MVSLPEIKDWTAEQISKACDRSPAVERYLRIIKTKQEHFSDQLRQQRHQAWVRSALATLHTTQSAEEICHWWSLQAIEVLKRAWTHHQLESESVCLVAMGKLGALELNLSSDIDVFFISQNEPSKNLLKKVRLFINSLNEPRSSGFCFRVDLDLRPGGSTSPLVISFDQMTNHYGYHGETWERVAMIRQNILFGPEELKKNISTFCEKFAFRKHIDYTLFHDLYSMRQKIQNHKFNETPWNIKFRKGGIRDLELLIHSLQLIHGGKNKLLVTGSVAKAIEELQRAKLLSEQDSKNLKFCYWFFREIENKIQCENDQHTYDLQPTTLVLQQDKEMFVEKANSIALIVDQFLQPYNKQDSQSTNLSNEFQSLELTDEVTQKAWFELLATKIQSRSKQRDEDARQLFLKNILLALKACPVDQTMALQHLQRFLMAIKAKTSFFTLFNQHPLLVEELVWIFSCSPFLAQILIHRPELIDSFLLKQSIINTQDEDQFHSSAQDFKLLSDLISSSQFLRQRDVHGLIKNLSQTTDTLVLHLLEMLNRKFNVQVSLLTLGKWAAREMGLTSDLDFIFLTDAEPHAAHFKMARRFIHFLNSPHSGQTLYHIDLRLRPSGNAGPLLLSKKELSDYLDTKAEIWERQAYLCYREIPERSYTPLFQPRSLSEDDRQKLSEIQQKLLFAPRDEFNLKKNWGGLLHTELTLQIALLDAQLFPQTPNVSGLCATLSHTVDSSLCAQIEKNYFELRRYQQLLILMSQNAEPIFKNESPEIHKLSSLLETSPKVLLHSLANLLQEQKTLLNKLDPLALSLKIEM